MSPESPDPVGIPLDAFDLIRPIGQGGMGQVWSGLHRDSGTELAIKFMSARHFARPGAVELFRTEVRAVARLNHPSIVLVYDHGQVDEAAAELSGGRLVEGSPYLVMELVTGGTLSERRPGSWREVRGVVRTVLDALAHAHARGVVHRDLKPSNILLSGAGDPRPGLKLSDFGAAHYRTDGDRMPREKTLVGTAAYIPPEQIYGNWRDFGPWTDLYALGVVVWLLVTGEVPFHRADLMSQLKAHLVDEPPPLSPRFPVPEGLEAWLRRLLAKDPLDRVRRAADAAWALEQLASPVDMPSDPPSDIFDADWSVALAPLARRGQTTVQVRGGFGRQPARDAAAPPLGPPPFPPRWQRQDPTQVALQLGGAGLGLFGVRALPMVGRKAERDRLWSALGGVVGGDGPAMVVVEGHSGLGKTRLVRWIAERAHELGAATVLNVDHGPIRGSLAPLPHLVEAYFGAQGLRRTKARLRIERILEEHGVGEQYETDAYLELIRPSKVEGAVRVWGPRERYALLDRLVERQARRRPVILVLDDLQWGLDSAAFAEHLLTTPRSAPLRVLILATLRRGTRSMPTSEASQLACLLGLDAVSLLPVHLLGADESLALVRDLLGLAGELAQEVAARAGGSPLFAVQLVAHQVARQLLVPIGRGFALKPGAPTDLPPDIHELWSRWVDRTLVDRPTSHRVALELAATLGKHVDDREWSELCALAGIEPPSDLIDALAERALAMRREGGWDFVHGLLRESIERAAREAGRGATHHRRCVTLLRRRHADPARLGRHLLEAGELDEALVALLAAADRAYAYDEYAEATRVLALRERAMERAELPHDDPRWGEGWERRGVVTWRTGDVDAGEALVQRAVRQARAYAWTAVLARALRGLARIQRFRGDLDGAISTANEAVSVAERGSEPRQLASARRVLGRILIDRGELDTARELIEDARRAFEEAGDVPGLIACERALWGIARQTGDLETARVLAEELRGMEELRGHRWGTAQAIEALGEVERYSGHPVEAERCYRTAKELFRSVNATAARTHASDVNIGLVLMDQGRYDEAHELLASSAEALELHGSRGLSGLVLCLLAAAAAGRRRWGEFDEFLGRGSGIVGDIGVIDVDLATVSFKAGELALEAGERSRGSRALALSAEQFEALGRPEDAARARRLAGD